jgi:hypothetical protein
VARPSFFFLLLFALCHRFTWSIEQSISAIENRPTYIGKDDQGFIIDGPPIRLRVRALDDVGDDPFTDTSVAYSKRIYAGCFRGPDEIVLAYAQAETPGATGWDPNDCIKRCTDANPTVLSYHLYVAISGSRCGCSVSETSAADALLEEVEETYCTLQCATFDNPLCGGNPIYWGVYMEYDMFSFAVQGAYDPTRYIWYTVVSIKVLTIKGGRAPPEYDELDNPLVPERYYLSAVDAGTGLPLFHYQTRLNSIVYGMHADIDSSRLVGVALDVDTGRVIQNRNWEYKLLTLYVNTTIPNYPKIEPTYGDLKISSAGSQRYMSYSGATTILSKLDLFIFTQNEDANLAKDMPDRVYVVMIPTGQFIHAQNVDFKFLQLFANEEFGDVTYRPQARAVWGFSVLWARHSQLCTLVPNF